MPNMTDPKIFENITKPMRYRASYQKKFYTVIWKNYDGTVLKTDNQVPALTAATPPNQPSKAGCNFIGWDKNYNKITEDTTITAQFSEAIAFTVTWKNTDGTILKTESVSTGNAATPPANPTMTGKNFIGWDKSYSNITSDVTITALYDVTIFTVTWKDKGGSVLKTETVTYNTAATPPTPPSIAGCTFKNWDKDYSHITSDLTITAVYDNQTFTVIWKTDSGDIIRTDSNVIYGTILTPPTPPSKTDSTFNKWDSTDFNIKSDKTFTAQYTQNAPAVSAYIYQCERINEGTLLTAAESSIHRDIVSLQYSGALHGARGVFMVLNNSEDNLAEKGLEEGFPIGENLSFACSYHTVTFSINSPYLKVKTITTKQEMIDVCKIDEETYNEDAYGYPFYLNKLYYIENTGATGEFTLTVSCDGTVVGTKKILAYESYIRPDCVTMNTPSKGLYDQFAYIYLSTAHKTTANNVPGKYERRLTQQELIDLECDIYYNVNTSAGGLQNAEATNMNKYQNFEDYDRGILKYTTPGCTIVTSAFLYAVSNQKTKYLEKAANALSTSNPTNVVDRI